ncbi:2'-5' RNA ligase family protein [Deinococcus altitudinis]|uniref:2'-5' RNA ligase family protein n=1 Tax=Deinococcus altitudinis TaxID=468914 RepID=UPI003891EBDD
MSHAGPPGPGPDIGKPEALPGPLYGLVAWPSPELDRWLRAQQLRLGVRAYGEPHLNLRAPFPISGTEDELVSVLRSVLGGVPCFDVQVRGWRTFPGVVFLECVRSAELETLHEQVLALKSAPPQPYDQKDYIPHLTLALGVLPWFQEQLEAELTRLPSPVTRFEVSALSLTREAGGEVREVRTFPLQPASAGENG